VQPQLLRQTPLPGAKAAFSASARLRRVGRNHLDPQFSQCPAHLRRAAAIDLLSGLRGMEEMAGAIAIQRAKGPFPFDDFP
jgi:hypothetical protein